MAITAYVGLPGSGKSYGVVENVVLAALKNGRRVWTNIPLNMDLIDREFGGLVTRYETKDILDDPSWFADRFESGATLVIDEAWRLWSAGLKANNMSEAHKSFLAEHRHMVGSDGNSTEIVFVTQDLAQIASYPRSLVETTYRSVKLIAVGQNNRFRVDIYEGAATGPKPPVSTRIRQQVYKYSPDIYKYYTSQTKSESSQHGSEKSTDSRTNILSSKWLLIGGPCFVVFMLFIVYSGLSDVSEAYNPEDQVESNQVTPQIPKYVPRKISHFYDGMTAHIIYTSGFKPFQDFFLSFSDKESSATLSDDDLAKMGYLWLAYDSCYGQLTMGDDVLNVFCKKDEFFESEEISTPDPFSEFAP